MIAANAEMTREVAHCASACAWGGLCAPGRCILAECADSPNYARFAPRPRHRAGRARLGPVKALAGLACAGGLALVLAHWWGIL